MLEIIAALTGAAYVVLAGRQLMLSWWLGLVNIICYIYVYFASNLYADVLLQFFYLVLSFYGILKWRQEFSVSRMILPNQITYILQSMLLSLVIFYVNIHLHEWLPRIIKEPAAYPLTDSFIAGFSIMATKLIAEKKLEGWLWWIIIDLLAAIIYWQKDLYITVSLFIFYAMLAGWSYYAWRSHSLRKVSE